MVEHASETRRSVRSPVAARGAWALFAAINGFVAVAMGAFAAHAIGDAVLKDWIRMAATYQFMHAMAIFASLSLQNWSGRAACYAPRAFAPGIIVFSGSLYAAGLGAGRGILMLTPVGGLLFLAGWVALALSAWQFMRSEQAGSADASNSHPMIIERPTSLDAGHRRGHHTNE